MTDGLNLQGECMLGVVKFSATAKRSNVVVCHCDMCRRWSAGPFMSVSCQAVTFDGQENISCMQSSDWVERGFCTKCGSNLFFHLVASDDQQIAAGLFDTQSRLCMSLQLFTDQKSRRFMSLLTRLE